jgi:hypothetical protein
MRLLMRDKAAVLLEPCGLYGHFPVSLLLLLERKADKGILNDQQFFLLPQIP